MDVSNKELKALFNSRKSFIELNIFKFDLNSNNSSTRNQTLYPVKRQIVQISDEKNINCILNKNIYNINDLKMKRYLDIKNKTIKSNSYYKKYLSKDNKRVKLI